MASKTEAQLQHDLNEAVRRYNEANSKNDEIERKIEALEEARRHLNTAIENVGWGCDAYSQLNADSEWKGDARTRFNSKLGDLAASGRGKQRELEGVRDEIDAKIRDLRSEMDYLGSMMNKFVLLADSSRAGLTALRNAALESTGLM